MPIESLQRPSNDERSKRRARRPKHRVLWVDDDANLTAAFSRRLRRKGIEVLPASDGMQGYWLTITKRPDLVITDLRMPRWEGSDLLDCLTGNDETAGVPIVVLSGYVTPEIESRLRRLGVAAVLDKPVAWRRLMDTLRNHLPK